MTPARTLRLSRATQCGKASAVLARNAGTHVGADALGARLCDHPSDVAGLLSHRFGSLSLVRLGYGVCGRVALDDPRVLHVRTRLCDRWAGAVRFGFGRLAHRRAHLRGARRALLCGLFRLAKLAAARRLLALAISRAAELLELAASDRVRRAAGDRQSRHDSGCDRILRRDLLSSRLRAGLGECRASHDRSLLVFPVLRQQLRAALHVLDGAGSGRVRPLSHVVDRVDYGLGSVRRRRRRQRARSRPRAGGSRSRCSSRSQ